MVTLTKLSVEDPEDESPLLPEATESPTPTTVLHRQQVIPCRETFLTRKENVMFSLLLMIICYLAILIPAYFPLNLGKSLSDDYPYPRDLAMLNRSDSLLSSPCQPHWSTDHLKHLSSSAGLLDVPVFVQQDRDAKWSLSPPLGLRGSEQHLALALASLPQPGPPPSLRRDGRCRRCVVVGSGGVLHGSHLGSHIDQYDIIIRMNNAPVSGFERDAGTQTTIRLIYPEGAPRSANDYKNTSMVALVVFKSLDLDWLTSIIRKKPLSFWSKLWFWKEVVDDIPMKPENLTILHPEIIHRTEEALKKYTINKGNSVPTLGASAVVMAMQLCDQVSLAGFGYDMQHPEARLHYYESIRMDCMKAQVVHDISAEKLFLRDLVSARAVTDLTGALLCGLLHHVCCLKRPLTDE